MAQKKEMVPVFIMAFIISIGLALSPNELAKALLMIAKSNEVTQEIITPYGRNIL